MVFGACAAITLLGVAANLKLFNPRAFVDRYDGTYICGEGPIPLTIRIGGGMASADLGVVRETLLHVEAHGSTISLSGGSVYDASGHALDAQEKAALTGGSDVDLLTVVDDGQALRMDLADGRRVLFVKQR